jgi:hypothetical protein
VRELTDLTRALDPNRLLDPQVWLDALPDAAVPQAAAIADALGRNAVYTALLNAMTTPRR